ncbi:type VII secretion protein EccE [Mycolicibacterium sp. YH-1]|uniref:type VII secretion protein EccE n=1 Tax=Mycolicibacterium sp. YH-1 TaxID=2908837 RepID=UPI001F4C35D9|nr:type VII secretion protein EccE [Mycolicibacterium sp. YH-1]UNB51998.1 type VII secretion protein EccE [Mycolicibacterium sp. YH-1]
MTARITLALLAIISAAMSYPFQTTFERWVLGVAVVVVLVVFAWWRGEFLTTMLGRRLAVWRRNHGRSARTPSDEVAMLLSVKAPAGVTAPLAAVAGYVERYGIRSAKVRLTNLDGAGTRRTWISVTLAATDNLAALQARSPQLPLYDTAEVVGRRLADHLRELGLDATIVDTANAPWTPKAKETWRGMRDEQGYLAAYAIPADAGLSERLVEVWSQDQGEIWTALEFTGTAANPRVVAVAAFRTAEAPSGPPVTGLKSQNGRHKPLLSALDPRSVDRLDIAAAPLRADALDQVTWPVGSDGSTVGAHARL